MLQINAMFLRIGTFDNVTANQKRDIFRQAISKVHQNRSGVRQMGEGKNLRSIVFHVLFDVVQLLDGYERIFVGLRLSCRAPIDI